MLNIIAYFKIIYYVIPLLNYINIYIILFLNTLIYSKTYEEKYKKCDHPSVGEKNHR